MEYIRYRIGVIVVLIGVFATLICPACVYGLKFTAVDQTTIGNTQTGLANLNTKFDKVENNVSALSGNYLSMRNEVSALSGNIIDLRVKIENTITAFNNAQLNLEAKITGFDKSIDNSMKANRDLYQSVIKKNDVGIYYSIIGVMGLIIILLVYWDKKRDSELLKAETASHKEWKSKALNKEAK